VDGGIVNGDAKPPLLGGADTGSGTGPRSDGAGRKKRGESEKKEKGEKEFHKSAVKKNSKRKFGVTPRMNIGFQKQSPAFATISLRGRHP
jgi:hypothetical protein